MRLIVAVLLSVIAFSLAANPPQGHTSPFPDRAIVLEQSSAMTPSEVDPGKSERIVGRAMSISLLLWVIFSVIYSVAKSKAGEAIVFADYTDTAMTLASIIVFPLLLALIGMAFEIDDSITTVSIFGQFLLISAISTRNVYHLNDGNIFKVAAIVTGRLVLATLMIFSLAGVFDKKRTTFDRGLALVFLVWLGKILIELTARKEFGPVGAFFGLVKLKQRFPSADLPNVRSMLRSA